MGDSDEAKMIETVRKLRLAADILEEQIGVAEPRFLRNAESATRQTVQWVDEIEEFRHRRTMPTTNRTASGKPAARYTIGYRDR